MASKSESALAIARLRWRCRRGMKELDAFFEPFVACALDDLAEDRRIALDALLDRPDQEILDWLLDDSDRVPAALEGIIRSIRRCSPGYRSALDDAEVDADDEGIVDSKAIAQETCKEIRCLDGSSASSDICDKESDRK
ncbi:MAG: succinate dehydrogenase assembly factor 2 [Ectothiorhodospiraceae bacterium AqS1]|nr:succinate dehydrogenase assembly factor 2 [Ectothiorhodospiraceae bacterium AqS1]